MGTDEEVVEVEFTIIHFGDLSVECPECGEPSEYVGMGFATDDQEGEDTFELQTYGIIMYRCGDTFATLCLMPKVARIIDAYEAGSLDMGEIVNLTYCEEHTEIDNED